ncbi:hypothetical protein LAZ67_5004174 [Cordylochernes scorpioides]|uniref:DUF5641 domain-containing protein n=1 Tax=Cordylochernes scorpioides TaxID=51811 RepID=A0ABY6KJL9_9ARAC|nr:hypothetical protein LAZ67_5004169 [Cordylochernes scorpioides]UYV68386.1 hypothetical protein LAZ67_5004174 [Cordylochernes scorpioides]
MFWPKGRIVKFIAGKKRRDSKGTLVRAIQRLYPLEITSNVGENQSDHLSLKPISIHLFRFDFCSFLCGLVTCLGPYKKKARGEIGSLQFRRAEQGARAQEERKKIRPEAQVKRQKIRPEAHVKRQKIRPEAQVKRQKIRPEALVKRQKIRPEAQVKRQNIRPEAQVKRQKIRPEAQVKRQKIRPEALVKRQKIRPEAQVKRQKIRPVDWK